MDIALVILGFLVMLLGIIGSFLPILPGPPISWLGLLMLHFTDVIPLDWTFLGITLFFALLIWALDYIIPIVGTKKFGGSKAGMIGTTLGLVIGLLAPIPGGIIIGPFVGAFIGELTNQKDNKKALKAAFGSFIGFLTGTFLKFVTTIIYAGLFIGKVLDHGSALFTV